LKLMFMAVIFFPLFKELLFPDKNSTFNSVSSTMNSVSTVLLAITFHSIISIKEHLKGKLAALNSFLGGTTIGFMTITIKYSMANTSAPESNLSLGSECLVMFFISIFYFFLVEFLKNVNASEITFGVKDEYKIDLSYFAAGLINFLKLLLKPLIISTVITFLLYVIVCYESTFVNHAGIFGAVFAVTQYNLQNKDRK